MQLRLIKRIHACCNSRMQQARLSIQHCAELHLRPQIIKLLALGMTSILLLPVVGVYLRGPAWVAWGGADLASLVL
jgi:hypothetical protein